MLDSDRYWHTFCAAIERPELEHDERFFSFAARAQNRDELADIIADRIGSYPLAVIAERLESHRCAFSIIAIPEEVLQDRQVLANGFLVPHPQQEGEFIVAPPIQFDEEPMAVSGPAPEVGQHTEEILLELGYDWDDILRQKDSGAIT
jgi:formyl-CoA transferase